jgi:hypothetical protein
LSIENLVFSAGGGFLFGAVAGYQTKYEDLTKIGEEEEEKRLIDHHFKNHFK